MDETMVKSSPRTLTEALAALHVAAAWATSDGLAAGVRDDALRTPFLDRARRRLPGDPIIVNQPVGPKAGRPLTRREMQIAALLTEGLTNRELAARLFLSELTVASHIRNILAKLDLSSRAQIAAWAVRQGLTTNP